MSSPLMALMFLVSAPQVPTTAEVIVENGYRTVIVCPRAISRDTDDGESFSGDAGAMSQELPVRIHQQLAEHSQFQVVSMRTADAVFKDVRLEDIAKPEFLELLHERTKADAVVLVHAENLRSHSPDEIDVSTEIIGLRTFNDAGAGNVYYDQSISDAAFAGASFELRRWVGGELQPIGFQEQYRAEPGVNGVGEAWEQMQFRWLKQDLPHPLESDLPYGLAIEVDGEPRPLLVLDGEYFVQIDEGEEFSVRVWNGLERRIYLGLYVDGINSLGGQFEFPMLVPTNRHWRLDPGHGTEKRVRIPGWSIANPATGTLEFNRFQIVAQADSVAMGQAMGDKFGMVTAIFYTDGVDPSWPGPDDAPRFKSTNRVGVGRGAADQARTSFKAGNRGVMLSAINIHYRTSDWFAAMQDRQRAPVPPPESTPDGEDTSATPGEKNAPKPADDPADDDETRAKPRDKQP